MLFMKRIKLTERQCILFERYLELLLKWNRTYNLTAVTDPKEIYDRHFADSMKPLRFLPAKGRLVDIGTGAGFPGIPIKILRPSIEVVLIEATRKKVNFCEHVIRELKLKGLKVIHGRAETKEVQKCAGKFDVVISRATMKLPELFRHGVNYLKPSGHIIAMMGPDWRKELLNSIDVASKCGLKLIINHEYRLRTSGAKRAILVFAMMDKSLP